jgi:hypothetical protein
MVVVSKVRGVHAHCPGLVYVFRHRPVARLAAYQACVRPGVLLCAALLSDCTGPASHLTSFPSSPRSPPYPLSRSSMVSEESGT